MPPLPSPTKDAAVAEATQFAAAARTWLANAHENTVEQLLRGDHVIVDGIDLSAQARELRDRRARTISRLPKEAAAIVDDLPGWTWRDPWTEFLAELDRWIAEHGTANVPQHATIETEDGQTYRLGFQVMRRRTEHARGALARDRVSELSARPGWTWDVKTKRRSARIAALRRYAKKHGTIAGSSLKTDDPSLYRWLLYQRSRDLTVEERAELAEIPGALPSAPATAAAEFAADARAWIDDGSERDITRIPPRGKDGSDNPLAKRARYLRGRQRAGKLSPDDAATLEQLPGWTDFTQNR